MRAGSVVVVIQSPIHHGPKLYRFESLKWALDVMTRWAKSRCFSEEGGSVFIREGRRWVVVGE